MIQKVKDYLLKHNINNKKVIVGFSSGPDSVAMAFLLYKLASEFNLKIVLAYFNHNWREEAKEEEVFTKNFANQLKAEFHCETAPNDSLKTEEKARELRYAFFEKTMKKFKTDIVFIAHNKNDNIETIVYRLIKGTGITGLCSIPQNRDNYHRPLLDTTKEEILFFLKEKFSLRPYYTTLPFFILTIY